MTMDGDKEKKRDDEGDGPSHGALFPWDPSPKPQKAMWVFYSNFMPFNSV
jgi:hypothetical protein